MAKDKVGRAAVLVDYLHLKVGHIIEASEAEIAGFVAGGIADASPAAIQALGDAPVMVLSGSTAGAELGAVQAQVAVQ